MKQLPLHDLHLQAGAEFTEYGDWNIPKIFTTTKDEYDAASGGLAVYDMSYRGKLRLGGKECLKFMQGMLSNDVLKLENGKGTYATLLNVKGRMIADLYIYRDGQDALMDMEQGLNEKVSELFLKYRLSYKATIDDVTEKYAQLCYIGPKSTQYFSRILGEDLSNLSELSFVKSEIEGVEVFVVKVKRTALSSFELYVPVASEALITSHFLKSLDDISPQFIGFDTYEILRVEAGIPTYGVDMDENTIPIEAGLWDALNFEKGCYIGQEVIARIKWRGHVNRHLVGFELDGEIRPGVGDKIYIDEKEIGYVTSSVFSYRINKYIALGYIRREYKEQGTRIRVVSSEKEISCAVVNIETKV